MTTVKEAWWAGARAGLGLHPSTPRKIVAEHLAKVEEMDEDCGGSSEYLLPLLIASGYVTQADLDLAHTIALGVAEVDMLSELYDAASAGFTTMHSSGRDGEYKHVSAFPNLDALLRYGSAWTRVMAKVRDARKLMEGSR